MRIGTWQLKCPWTIPARTFALLAEHPSPPLFFAAVMKVIMQDATATPSESPKTALQTGGLWVSLFADDCLCFVGKHQGHLQELLNAVAVSGGEGGVALHWGNFQVLRVQKSIDLCSPSGAVIQPKDRLLCFRGCNQQRC